MTDLLSFSKWWPVLLPLLPFVLRWLMVRLCRHRLRCLTASSQGRHYFIIQNPEDSDLLAPNVSDLGLCLQLESKHQLYDVEFCGTPSLQSTPMSVTHKDTTWQAILPNMHAHEQWFVSCRCNGPVQLRVDGWSTAKSKEAKQRDLFPLADGSCVISFGSKEQTALEDGQAGPSRASLAAMLLLCLGSLGSVIALDSSPYPTPLAWDSLLLLLLAGLVCVSFMAVRSRPPEFVHNFGLLMRRRGIKGIRVFIAASMSSISQEERNRQSILLRKAVKALRDKGATVHWPSAHSSDDESSEKARIALADSMWEIAKCDQFFLIHSADKQSSALIETGLALASGKPSVIFVHHLAEVPFLLNAKPMKNIKIVIYTDTDHLLSKLADILASSARRARRREPARGRRPGR